MVTSSTRTTAAILLFTALGCTFEASLPGDEEAANQAGAPSQVSSKAHARQPSSSKPAAEGSNTAAASGVGRELAADGELIPQELVGSWYASSGHTSVPVDPVTGSFGTPNGDSLLYQFNADGSYQKAFQSSASNAGCTTGFTANESGEMQPDGHNLRLVPAEGHIRYADNCAPSLDSDKPIDDLVTESFTWQLSDDGLQLTRDDGASSTFVRAAD